MSSIREFSVERTDIDGLVVVRMKEAGDQRGVVREFYRVSAWEAAGLDSPGPWVQINVTESRRGAVRGLHAEAMTKLVAVASGEAFGAYVDTRPSSPTFRAVVTVPLAAGVQVLVPSGVANGYQSLTDTQYVYCFDVEWEPGMAGVAVNPLDPALGIDWPLPVDPDDPSSLSAKDAAQPSLAAATGTTN